MIRYAPAKLPLFRTLNPVAERPIHSETSEPQRLTASASDGIYEILRSTGTTGRVLIPAYTCSRVVYAVLAAGDQPQFIDVDPASGSLDSDKLGRALRYGAKAVVLTHLFGWDEQFDAHCRHATSQGLIVIEDSALILNEGTSHRNVPSASVASFGRGKPLPIGGGGKIRFYDKTLLSLHDRWLSEPDRRNTFAVVNFLRGALRDSSAALRLANVGVRLRARRRYGQAPTLDDDFTPRRLSDLASNCIKHQLQRSSICELAGVSQAALDSYRQAFASINSGLAKSIGFRLPKGTAAPALALRCSPHDRESMLVELALQWVDCPRYWQYCLGEEMSGDRFPGSRQLADSLLFLPLHRAVDTSGAETVARTLQRYQLQPFN